MRNMPAWPIVLHRAESTMVLANGVASHFLPTITCNPLLDHQIRHVTYGRAQLVIVVHTALQSQYDLSPKRERT